MDQLNAADRFPLSSKGAAKPGPERAARGTLILVGARCHAHSVSELDATFLMLVLKLLPQSPVLKSLAFSHCLGPVILRSEVGRHVDCAGELAKQLTGINSEAINAGRRLC
jgi:hypothetical protein